MLNLAPEMLFFQLNLVNFHEIHTPSTPKTTLGCTHTLVDPCLHSYNEEIFDENDPNLKFKNLSLGRETLNYESPTFWWETHIQN